MERCLFTTMILVFFACAVLSEAANTTRWGSWTAEPENCERQCKDPVGIGEYFRDCLECSETSSCVVTDSSRCEGASVKVGPCFASTFCTGKGLYTGQMSPWFPASLCPNPKLPCTGYMRTFKRTCQRTERSGTEVFKCPGDTVLERKELCLCGLDDPADVAVSHSSWGWLPRYGVWSEWSEFSCQQLCVNTTRRTRQCETRPGHIYECPMDAEGRLNEEVSPCRINGKSMCKKHWSTWSSWSRCSDICDPENRVQTRQRKCLGNGDECPGEDSESVLCPRSPCTKGWSNWSEWTKCRDGCVDDQIRTRGRTCLNSTGSCKGEKEQTDRCPYNETVCGKRKSLKPLERMRGEVNKEQRASSKHRREREVQQGSGESMPGVEIKPSNLTTPKEANPSTERPVRINDLPLVFIDNGAHKPYDDDNNTSPEIETGQTNPKVNSEKSSGDDDQDENEDEKEKNNRNLILLAVCPFFGTLGILLALHGLSRICERMRESKTGGLPSNGTDEHETEAQPLLEYGRRDEI